MNHPSQKKTIFETLLLLLLLGTPQNIERKVQTFLGLKNYEMKKSVMLLGTSWGTH